MKAKFYWVQFELLDRHFKLMSAFYLFIHSSTYQAVVLKEVVSFPHARQTFSLTLFKIKIISFLLLFKSLSK